MGVSVFEIPRDLWIDIVAFNDFTRKDVARFATSCKLFSEIAQHPKIQASLQFTRFKKTQFVSCISALEGDSKAEFVTCNLKGQISVWDLTVGSISRSMESSNALGWISLTPDASFVGVATATGVEFYDSQQTTQFIPAHTDTKQPVLCVRFNPQLYQTAYCCEDLKIWDFSERRFLFVITEHTARVNRICYHPEGKILVSASEDKTIRFWDIQVDPNEPAREPEGGSKIEFKEKRIVFSEPVLHLEMFDQITQGIKLAAGTQKDVFVFDFDTQRELAKYSFESRITTIAIHSSHPLLAVAEESGLLHLRHLTGPVLRVLTSYIPTVALAFKQKNLIVARKDHCVGLWDISSMIPKEKEKKEEYPNTTQGY